jgi:hypothetical protein
MEASRWALPHVRYGAAVMRCWPSVAAYHAYWRARGYRNAIRLGKIVLCTTVALGVGGAGTVIANSLYPSVTQAQAGPIKVDAP